MIYNQVSIPAFSPQINELVTQISPSTIHIKNTALSAFFRKYLMERAMSVYEWILPENWPLDYVLWSLYCMGYVAVLRTDKFGVIPQICGLYGYDVYYRPSKVIVVNPLIDKTLMPTIGENCVLMKLKPDYTSILDLVCYYGDMLALCAETAGVNLMNSHVSYVFGAQNKAQAEAFKKILDMVSSGETCAITDKNMFTPDGKPNWNVFTQDVKQNYITSDILLDMAKIRNQFDTEIGIPNANTDKRERLVEDEVNANNIETLSNASLWLDSLKKGCKEVNEMFGKFLDKKLSVNWRFNVKGGGTDASNNERAGALQVG